MDKVLKPDLCVVGAGKAGATAALAAARSGARVVVVDDGLARAETAGGDVAAAMIGLAHRACAPASGALPLVEPAAHPDFAPFMADARAIAARLSAEFSPERLVACGIHVIRSDARFTDRKSLVAGETIIRAKRFLVATGTTPVAPALPGLSDIDALTVEALTALSRRPSHLVVIGGGCEAVELAQAFLLLGARVTLVCNDALLPSCDREIVGFLERRLRLQGVSFHTGAEPLGVERRGKTGIRLTLRLGEQTETIDASHLLLADREPRLGGLDLARAKAGTNSRIRIVGDQEPSSPPVTVVRTDPALAWIGDVEPPVRDTGAGLLRIPLCEAESARTEAHGPGLLKLTVDRDGRVLSAAMAGGPAPDHIALWALARAKGMTLADLATLPAHSSGGLSLAEKAHAAFTTARPAPGLWRRMLGRT